MKKIRVAVIGAGYLGRIHAQKYASMEEAELIGVVDSDCERGRQVAAEFNTKAYSDHSHIMGLVDAVSVVTPTEHHYRVGMDLLSKGVDVMMEKPMAMDVNEAEALIKEAERKKAVLQVGHLERFNGALLAARPKISNPVFLEAFRVSPFPHRATDVDVILDLMIHDIDIVLNIAKSGVERVEAFATPVLSPKADFATAKLTFQNGCVANLTASRVSRERTRKLNIIQTDACMTVDFTNHQLHYSRIIPAEKQGLPASFSEEETITDKKDAILEELRAFLKASAERSSPLVTGADGKSALEVAGLIQKAANAAVA